MTYMYNMVKYNYSQGIFFVFVTAINLVFLYHTMLFHKNIIDAYLFTIVSQENKTNCACVHRSGNSAKDFRLGIHKNKFETTSFSLSNSSCRCVVKLANRMPYERYRKKPLLLLLILNQYENKLSIVIHNRHKMWRENVAFGKKFITKKSLKFPSTCHDSNCTQFPLKNGNLF